MKLAPFNPQQRTFVDAGGLGVAEARFYPHLNDLLLAGDKRPRGWKSGKAMGFDAYDAKAVLKAIFIGHSMLRVGGLDEREHSASLTAVGASSRAGEQSSRRSRPYDDNCLDRLHQTSTDLL